MRRWLLREFLRVLHGLVVVVGDVVLGDLIGGGLPDPVVGHDVGQHVVEVFDAVGLADQERVQGDAHDPTTFRAFLIQPVELRLADVGEVLGGVVVVSQH